MPRKSDGTEPHHAILIDVLMRDLAANMLRVMRGSGQPAKLHGQIGELWCAVEKFCDSSEAQREIAAALRSGLAGALDKPQQPFGSTLPRIQSAALRQLAANLLGQRDQASLGDNDLWEALLQWERKRATLKSKPRAKLAARKRKH